MLEETNKKKKQSRLARNLSTQAKKTDYKIVFFALLSVLIMVIVISITVARIVFNFDGISQKSRVKALHRDAPVALQFGLTGHSNYKSTQTIVSLTNNEWQNEIATSVEKAWESGGQIADSVTFDGHKYEKKAVINQLSQRYLRTIKYDRNYKILEVTYDRYHNAKVRYRVVPVNLPAAQKKVQRQVEKQLQTKSEQAAKLSSDQLRLVEYAMIANNWDNVLKNKIPTATAKVMTMPMLYEHKNFRPSYKVSKQTLNNILNSGLSE
ncbi:hypothetical protein GCM10025879_00640 [Leuconostoc litchii]|uniref:GTP-binding protein n=1 Tax=Leuconostoc litchii TaxID=1981069 RepID=A0A6P2CLP2_9LACO|nr:GTP-binding protein [Leuconostoc litchii]TYC46915.1 GTP-binding protein [Leuconostoc litchii]GMA68818.1 hypothetical protein GCM10025879_00640 [Leuconostoc litchii]